MPDVLLAFTSPKPGREEEYIDWYRTRHVADIVAVPGVLSGQFFRLAVPREARWRFALVYELETGAGPAAIAEIQRRLGGPQMPLSDALEGYDGMFGLPLCDWTPAEGATVDDAREAPYRLIALGRAHAGREEEYLRWYGERHLPDVLGLPGMIGAQRFALEPTGASPDLPYAHLAIFAARTDSPRDLVKELVGRAGTEAMPSTDAMDRDGIFFGVFEAVTPLHVKEAAEA